MVFPTAIGPHRASLRGDLIEMQFVGSLTLEHVVALRALMHQVRGEHGRCYMLADSAGLTGIATEARKALSEWGRLAPDDRISGCGVHGISFAMRALSMLTLGAVKFMTRRPVNVYFASDEAEARAWIDGRRATDSGRAAAG